MFEPLELQGLILIRPRRLVDERGWFSETYHRARYSSGGLDAEFVQDNQSLSRPCFTVRGFHYQRAPFAQGKLVRVLRGRIVDVALDLRAGSPTYGRHAAVELSAEGGEQLWVPVGFGHAFCTLEPDTEVAYKVTAHYSAEHEGGVLWSDPDLGVEWPCGPAEVAISEKDARLPRLSELAPPF